MVISKENNGLSPFPRKKKKETAINASHFTRILDQGISVKLHHHIFDVTLMDFRVKDRNIGRVRSYELFLLYKLKINIKIYLIA